MSGHEPKFFSHFDLNFQSNQSILRLITINITSNFNLFFYYFKQLNYLFWQYLIYSFTESFLF